MAFGADRTVSVTLKAKVQEYLGPLDSAKKATQDFGKSTSDVAAKHKTAFRDIGLGMAAAGAAIAGGIGLAIKSFADFDQEMSAVKAVSNATAGEMDSLRQAALDAGAATVFSAGDAAKAEEELVKAGIGVKDVLGGALTGTLSLAAAGNLDLADAATIAANAMNIFSLKGDSVGHIADVLASAANKSAADVDQLAQGMQQSGLIAAQMGISLEDTTGILAAFADNGLKGSDAGTSFKTMLQRLVPTSVAAATAMEDIGFNAYDAQGNLKSIDQVAQNLQDSLKGLTQRQKDQTLATIFGSDAVRGANVLMKLGADGVKEYTAAVNDQGAAQRVAAERMNNLAGDVENLRGSLETALIKGGSGANDALRGLASAATSAVNAFSGLPSSAQSGVVGIATVTSGVLLLGGGLITAVPKIKATKEALDALALASPQAGAALGKLGAFAVEGAVVVGMAALANQIRNVAAESTVGTPSIDKLSASMSGLAAGAKDAGAFGDLVSTHGLFRTNEIKDSTEAIKDFGANAKAALRPEIYEGFSHSQSLAVFNDRVQQIDSALAQMVKSGHADDAKKLVDELANSTVQFGGSADEVRSKFTAYQGALDTATVANGKYATSTDLMKDATKNATGPGTLLADEIKKQEDAATNAKAAYDKLTQAVKGYGDQVDASRSATAGYEASIDNAADVAKKRADLQSQIDKLSAGDINKKYDATDAKTAADFDKRIKEAQDAAAKADRDFDQRIKDAKSADAKSKIEADKKDADAKAAANIADLRTNKADTLGASKTSRSDALSSNADQIARLKKEQEGYAATLDLGTEAGRRNDQLLRDMAKSAKNAAVENFKNGDSVGDVQKKMEGARDAFIKQAQDFGASKDEAEKYADALGLTKENVDKLNGAQAIVDVQARTDKANDDLNRIKSTLDSTNGTQAYATVNALTGKADGNILQTDGLLDSINGKIVTAHIELIIDKPISADAIAGLANGTMGPKGFATGGFTGFGEKYEPAGIVHRGEYVFTKEETSKAGVATLAAYARSLRGYADGGLVASAMSSAGGPVGGAVTHDNRMYVDKLQGPTLGEIQREADRKRRLHALRGRRAG